MCGIAGKYNLNLKHPVSPKIIKAMCDVMAYRGPDDSGVYVDGPVGLGHRRLSILDLSKSGHQPMSTADKSLWVTFNGEIYNFLKLRENLTAKGYVFSSDCDTEVILALYQEYGPACLQYLRGMFAFCIWDKKNNTLFLARDRIGKKPLYYYFDGKTFIFASEIKAILQDPSVEKKINYEALSDYFRYLYVPDPKTIYQNIYKLEPGYALYCDRNSLKKEAYWDVSFAETSKKSEHDLCENLVHLLDESVQMRMISDVPLGAFLSGGIDSSAVVAFMAGHTPKPVTTCAIGFDSREYDEVAYARIVAEKFKTDHHEFTVKQDIEAILPELVRYFDEPFADASSVPTYYVSKIARQQVTVALSGDGGDENFAGYEKYAIDDIENNIRKKIPGFIRGSIFPFLSRVLSTGNHPVLRKGSTLLGTLSHTSDYGFYLSNTEGNDAFWQSLMNEETKRAIGGYDPFSVTKYHYDKADTEDHLSKILYTDLKSYLPGDVLVKVDRMSMANSLEVRAPLLDHRVIEFAATIPGHLKYYRGQKKYILKQSLAERLPDEILHRKKMGFSAPLAQWLRKEIRTFAESHILSHTAGLNHFFEPTAVRRIWDLHQTRKRNYATVLWSLLMFELWYQECFLAENAGMGL